MKKAAGIISLIVALILLGGAFFDYKEDTEKLPERIAQGYRDMHNDEAFRRDMQEIDDRKSSEMIRSLAGAAFLITGLVLMSGQSATKRETEESITLNLS
jgi:hypothetical protein